VQGSTATDGQSAYSKGLSVIGCHYVPSVTFWLDSLFTIWLM